MQLEIVLTIINWLFYCTPQICSRHIATKRKGVNPMLALSYKKRFIEAACLTMGITHKAAEALYRENKAHYGYIKNVIRSANIQ